MRALGSLILVVGHAGGAALARWRSAVGTLFEIPETGSVYEPYCRSVDPLRCF